MNETLKRTQEDIKKAKLIQDKVMSELRDCEEDEE